MLAGAGSARRRVERRAAGLSNLRLLPLQPTEEYAELMSCADEHVLPERPGASGLLMPSKFGAMLASGRPVVVAADAGSELARIARHVGLVVPPNNPHALAQSVERLARDPNLRRELGARGRKYAEQHLSKDLVLTRFNNEILKAVASP